MQTQAIDTPATTEEVTVNYDCFLGQILTRNGFDLDYGDVDYGTEISKTGTHSVTFKVFSFGDTGMRVVRRPEVARIMRSEGYRPADAIETLTYFEEHRQELLEDAVLVGKNTTIYRGHRHTGMLFWRRRHPLLICSMRWTSDDQVFGSTNLFIGVKI